MGRPKFKVDPGDVPAAVAARRMGLSEAEFANVLADLHDRGFPLPDETTGMFDLAAIDEWRRRRHPHLFVAAPSAPRDSRGIVQERLARLK